MVSDDAVAVTSITDSKRQQFIYPDHYKVKDSIWEAYSGYGSAYSQLVANQILRRKDNILAAKLARYASMMWQEVFMFIPRIQHDALAVFDLARVKSLVRLQINPMNIEDYTYLMDFFSVFMDVSGIHDIVMVVDNSDRSAKIFNNEYGDIAKAKERGAKSGSK